MADKINAKSTTMWSSKPVKMKLFGAWEIDKTPSDCIPRLCSLNITRIVFNKSIVNYDIQSIMVAVKMQNSKRILRSNEIILPFNNCNDDNQQNQQSHQLQQQQQQYGIELDLSFTLQYPHFIKRNRNHLQIILQRRKKYKNKAILGYKTLACGLIDMVEVLQKSTIIEKNLDLIGRIKEMGKNEILARITISSLKSQPIDNQDNINNVNNNNNNLRRGKISIDRPDVYSDDDDFTSAEDGSDSETIEESNVFRRKINDRKSRKLFSNNEKFRNVPTNAQQRNLKQKFISLLKKFRLPDSEAYDSEEKFQEALEKELMSSTQEPPDIDEFFDDEEIDDLDYLTDSGQEFDDVSISSTPKPSLRPFFSSCTLVGQDKSYEFPIDEHNHSKDSHNSQNHNHSDMKKQRDESLDTSGTDGTPDNSDTSIKQTNFESETLLSVPLSHNYQNTGNKKKSASDKESKRTAKLFPKDNKHFNHHHQQQHHHSPSNLKEKDKKSSSLHTTMSLLTTNHHHHHHKDDMINTNTQSKEYVIDQLNKMFPMLDEQPDEIIFLNLNENFNLNNQQQQQRHQSLMQMFERASYRIIGTNTMNEIKFSFNFICNRIQKLLNNNNLKMSMPLKMILIGSDSYVNSFLRCYVESLANKSSEWQNFFRFYIIPINYLYQNYSSSFAHHSYAHYGSNMLHKYLASIDQTYSQCFFPTKHQQTINVDPTASSSLSSRFINDNVNSINNHSMNIDNNNLMIREFYQKIVNFIKNAQQLIQVPIAEAMITYKDKIFDDESNQVFIPFICDVKIGLADYHGVGGYHSIDDESFNFSTTAHNLSSLASSSNQHQQQQTGMMNNEKCITSPTFNLKDQQQSQHNSSTPPNSPSMTNYQMNREPMQILMNETMDLQVDYWISSIQPKIFDASLSTSSLLPSTISTTMSSNVTPMTTIASATASSSTLTTPSLSSSSSSAFSSKKSDNCKFTLKNSFRHVQITRLPSFGETNSSSLTFSYITKEKKQKIMRLGKKKDKDSDNRCPRQTIDGICRLVCSYKTSQSPIKLIIDGVEYSGVKFFQITPQWQTQVKFFPVVIYSNCNQNQQQQLQQQLSMAATVSTVAATTTTAASLSLPLQSTITSTINTLNTSKDEKDCNKL